MLTLLHSWCAFIGRDLIPHSRLRLHEACRVHLSEAAAQASICEDVVASIKLLRHAPDRNFCEGHAIESLLLSEHLVPRGFLAHVSRLIPLLFILLPLVLLLQPALVLCAVVDWVVHHCLILNTQWQLLHFVLAVDLLFCRAIVDEIFLLVPIDVRDSDWIEIACLPERLGCLCAHNFVIHLHLLLVVLQVPIRNYIVVSLKRRSDGLASDFLAQNDDIDKLLQSQVSLTSCSVGSGRFSGGWKWCSVRSTLLTML